ncbi:hypothetical protein [Flavobacterium sp.]|uniref:hypothetical protein n=1 Tax=Flavobacterium sp. TaxID=239 RepID=UPI002621D074|nr:hypothetical protein [Flavobacterium sp.]
MSEIFEKITEIIGWLQIVASPLLLCSAIGAIIYFTNPTFERLLLAIFIAIIGLIIGIRFANKMWKTKGTIWFVSRISASPELDKNEEKSNSKNQ